MDSVLYVSSAGAAQIMRAQAVSANNLANINTKGFRADMIDAEALTLSSDLVTDAEAFVTSDKVTTDFTPGTIVTTGRQLDIAVDGNGFIAVQAADGSEAYTRNGSFQLDASGILRTSSGQVVLGNGGPIAIPPAEKIEIGVDGTINIRPLGQEGQALATLDRIKLVSPNLENFVKGEDGLFRNADNSPAVVDGSVRVVSGAVENSNVNAINEMIDIISLARQFEMQMKLFEEVDVSGDQTNQLLQLNQ